MNEFGATATLSPESYALWRASSLGLITDELEHRLMLQLMGEIAGRRILDVGCGDGALACATALRGAKVSGIDPDPAMLAAARSRADMMGVKATFLEGRVERLPFPDASFDVLVAVTVLCFVPDAAVALREMARVLVPGGRLVLGELGRWNLWSASRRIRGWLGSATWRSARFRTASELRALAEQAGLSVTTVRGAIYYPPVGPLAHLLAPIDSCLGPRTTLGAAFIALAGTVRRRR